MSTLEDLHRLLVHDFTDSVYVVERSDTGIDVTINIVDVEYYAVLYKKGVKKLFTHHVEVDETAQTYTITDDEYSVSWKAGVDLGGGVPQIVLARVASRQLGTVKKFETRKTYAFDEDGEFGKVEDWTFSSEESRRVVQQRAEELGLKQKMGAITTLGVAFAIGGLVIAVVVLIVVFLVLR